MSDKPFIDSNNFEALAYGVFTNAADTDSGRAALLQAYDMYEWTNPEEAQKTLEYYGENLKYKNKDQAEIPDIENVAPVKLQDIPLEGLEDDVDLYNEWERLNNEYLSTTDQPQYLVARKDLQESIKAHASRQRRGAQTAAIKENVGETGAAALDFNARFVQGAASGVEALINSGVNIFTDGYELNSELTELTDPERDGKFISNLASASGSVAGVLTAGAVAGPAGVAAYSTAQAVDATGTRYQETLRRTGDPALARKAALIEGGSQALQLVGEQLVFGKLFKGVPKKSPVGEVAKSGLIEAGTEGTGQVISNVAENIETGREGDITRGVEDAVLLGGVLAAGTTTGSHILPGGVRKVFPAKNNTIARKNELQETGTTFTPVTKQVIGSIQPAEVVTDPAVTEDTDVAEEQVLTVEAVESQTQPVPPEQPSFVTEEDAGYYKTGEGQYRQEDSLPHDKTFFINESTASNVSQSLLAGEHVTLNKDGEPVILKATPDGDVYENPIQVLKEPSTGTYPLEISHERSPSSQEVVRPVKIGQRIKTVNIDRSLGAASEQPVEQRESTYSQKLRDSTLPAEMKAVGEKGIFYTPITRTELPNELQAVMREGGIEQVISILNDQNQPLKVRGAASTFLNNYFAKESIAALQAGDVVRNEQLMTAFRNLAPNISAIGTEFGQTGITLQGKTYDPFAIQTVYNKAYETELAEQSKTDEEGATPLEIGESEQILADVNKATAITQANLERQQAIDANLISPEDAAVNEIVADIEDQAAQKVAEDIALIDREQEDLSQEVAKINKKAERTKRKDITALEGAVAKDSQELVNALNDAKDIKEITAEESAKLESDIASTLESAEKKANAEISKAVKEERANKETEKKSRLEASEDRIVKAEKALADRKATASEQLKKLKLRQRLQEKNGEDSTATQQKIQEVEDRITRAAQKVVDAKEAARVLEEELNAKTEADQEADELLNELEAGVEIRISPVGKKRRISVKTKRTGMDITKLFGSKSEAYAPLLALSKNVNELASTLKQSLGARSTNNERISALQKRINENKAALEKARTRDSLSAQEKARIAAAKKRLADLDKAKQEATVESRIPKNKKEQYRKFKDRQAAGTKAKKEDSEQVKQAKETLRQLEKERNKAERLLKKREAAKLKAAEAVRQMTVNQQRIAELKNILATQNLTHTQKNKVNAEIRTLEATYEANPDARYDLFGMWAANVIDGLKTGTLSIISLGTTLVTNPVALAVSDVINTGKLALDKTYPSKLQSVEYVKGLASLSAMGRALSLAKIAFLTGQRLPNILKRGEVALAERSPVPLDRSEFYQDFFEHSKNLKFEGSALQKFYTGLAKVSGRFTVIPMRFLAATEAITYSISHSAFDRAAAANYYNNAKKGFRYSDIETKTKETRPVTPEELAVYEYNPVENWQNALAFAQHQADTLNAAGIPVSKEQQYIDAVEKYQATAPKSVQISAYKQAIQLVGNGPAQGFAGAISDGINYVMHVIGADRTPVKLLTMFTNSIAQFANVKLAWTPWGILDSFKGRTQFEKDFIRSQAITGSIMGVALLSALRQQDNDEPEKDNWFDIVSRDNGYTYTFKMGNTYLNVQDTPLALWAYGLGKARDNMRAGKDPDPVTTTVAMNSAFTALFASGANISGSMQMLRGITDILEAIKASAQGKPDSEVLLARSLMQPIKGFVPGTAMLRMASRFFDNPVLARKDIMSALVEGWPGLQSAYGKPALNIFGEPLKSGTDDPDLNIHRIFSTKPSDVDLRWLLDNGYSTPTISRMPIPKKGKEYLKYLEEAGSEDAKEIDYALKYSIYRAAAPRLRDLVAKYRSKYSHSAYNEKIQESLNKHWNKIIAQETTKQIFTP